MPELLTPSPRFRESFAAACAEEPGSASGWRRPESELADPDTFAGYVRTLIEAADPDRPRPEHLVPGTMLWWVDQDTYLGRVSIRHRLNERLAEIGGHIGYWIRPSARRQGHGLAMVRAALPYANRLGIDPALVTCDADNLGSRRIIERLGGMLEDQRGDVLRFWVPTG